MHISDTEIGSNDINDFFFNANLIGQYKMCFKLAFYNIYIYIMLI